MKRSRFSEEQIAYALRLAESGTPVVDVCRQIGVSEATYYTWKKKFGDLGVSELKRLRMLEDENARLKRIVADLTLDKQILHDPSPVDPEEPTSEALGSRRKDSMDTTSTPQSIVQPNPTSSIDLSAMALQVCSPEEPRQMSRPEWLSLLHLMEQRALRPGPPPTHNELLGIRKLVLEHLSHPALSALSNALPRSDAK